MGEEISISRLEVPFLPDRFCEKCGAPLVPGVLFCEECGNPVASVEAVSSGTTPSTPSVPELPETILAVLPFCSRRKGFVGTEDLSIVLTSRRLVPVVWDPAREEILKPLRKRLSGERYEMEREGRNPLGLIAPLAFDPGTVFPPWGQIFPDIAGIPGTDLREIEYIRGEQADSAHYHEDLLVISTAAGEQELYVETGWYSATSSRLLELVWDAVRGSAGEDIVGIIPLCAEPEREGFGFAYSFTLIVTTGRIIYAFIGDSFADMQTAYLKRLMKETGKDRRQLGETISAEQPADAPWQVYRRKPPVEILAEDTINFFIPLSQVRMVTVVPGKKNSGDLLVLALSSHEEELSLDPGFGDLAYSTFSRVLGQRVKRQ